MEKKNAEGLTDQEQNLQKDEGEYVIYITRISEGKESDTDTKSDESPYFFKL